MKQEPVPVVPVRKSNKRMEAKLKELCHTETTESTERVYDNEINNDYRYDSIFIIERCDGSAWS